MDAHVLSKGTDGLTELFVCVTECSRAVVAWTS